MADVTRLRAVGPTASAGVIELLEGALARARCGAVLAVAVVEVRVGGVVEFEAVDCDQYHALNSGCARLASFMASIPGDEG